jgi:hypothetical protein
MIGAVGDRIIASIYSEIPDSSAVSVLDVGPDKILSAPVQAGPGTPDRPRPSLMTRAVRYARRTHREWTNGMPFPDPLQAMLLALGVALAFLLASPERFTSPIYGAVNKFGGEAAWGSAFCGVAVALFVCWRWFHHGLFLAYLLAATANALFAWAAWNAFTADSAVAPIAFVYTAWVAIVHAMAATRASGEWRIERWLRSKIRRP